jgi:glycosyltransferase involved in cell wall biosynthesis
MASQVDAAMSMTATAGEPLELSIVMPCLDEAETVATCVRQAHQFLDEAGIAGEVIVADNGSTDGSPELAAAEGARVVEVRRRGYGAALMGGIAAARGRFVIMGDADESYDFSSLQPFVDELRAGADLVMGDRFAGGIEPGAMPWLHRRIGNPVLSFVGRLFFGAPVHDFHCGLRGFRRDSVTALDLRTTGMEFASEMVVKACLAKQRIAEVPTTLSKDGRSRPPHLRSFRDGWRHLRFLLIYSPRWLYLYPGLALMLAGLAASVALVVGPVTVGSVTFDVGTLIYTSVLVAIGYQSVLFAILTKAYAVVAGLLPPGRWWPGLRRFATLEVGLLVGLALVLAGALGAIVSFVRWREEGFGELDAAQNIRVVVPAAMGLLLGVQTVLGSLYLGVLAIGRPDQQ